MAQENSTWRYDRMVRALANVGHQLSGRTVGNILRWHGISPAVITETGFSVLEGFFCSVAVPVGGCDSDGEIVLATSVPRLT